MAAKDIHKNLSGGEGGDHANHEKRIGEDIADIRECLAKIETRFSSLSADISEVKGLLHSKDGTVHQFYKKRIQIAVDELFDYVHLNMKNALFIGGKNRLLLKEKAMQDVAVNGAYLEFGVWKGASLSHMADIRNPEIVYGFDSFEGLSEDWGVGHSDANDSTFFGSGTFKVETPQMPENVVIYPGWFDETIDQWLSDNTENIAYLHIDCDLYSSTKTILEKLRERIIPGTVIVFDEYFGYFEWKEGEYKAFQEFVAANHITYEYLYYRYDQAAVILKTINGQ